jgi:microcystin-dependent protein
MAEPFLGEIRMMGFSFNPRGWALCNGQLMSISQNTALFALLGTTYGGDGISTFALPDLQGRVAIHQGQGTGLPSYTIGERAGETTHTLITTEMPMHNHLVAAANVADATSPASAFPGSDTRGTPLTVYNSTTDGTTMSPSMVGIAGGSQPHNNMQPYLTINYCIALEGIFPSRN